MPFKQLLALELWWITLIILQAHIHFYMIDILKKKPIYLKWFAIRGSGALFFLFVFMTEGISWDLLPVLTFCILSHFVLFNPTLNKLRAKHNPLAHIDFWYVGKDSGWFDSLFLRHKILHRIAYYVSFLGMWVSAFYMIEIYYYYGSLR